MPEHAMHPDAELAALHQRLADGLEDSREERTRDLGDFTQYPTEDD